MRLRLDYSENGSVGIVEDAYYEAYIKSEKAFEEKNYCLALEILNNAIKSNEQSDGDPWERADFYVKCAENYRTIKESDLEFAALTKAIELRGFDWDYQKRACVYAERGDYSNAIADYTKAIEIDEAPESYQWRGEIFFKKNDYDSAIADFLKAIELCSNKKQSFCKGCLECYYLCSDAYFKKGDLELAMAYLDKALEMEQRQ
jgi:tetratricopeptide (TPR) repeat protein